jgi:hypothetical protein
MHIRKFGLLLLLLMGFSQYGQAYSDKKVIMVANRADQKDSIGYNIVAELSRYMYDWIQSDKVVLWDSPEKKYSIKKADLEGMETSSQTKFTELHNIFVYETWTSTSKKFSSELKGFSFAGENKRGEEVLYGYVENTAAIRSLLAEAVMNVNANANAGTTLLQALTNKDYDYTIVFFDDAPIKDARRSIKIQKNALGSGKKISGSKAVPEVRRVIYSIEEGPSQLSLRSTYIAEQLEAFFNQNPQEFFNYGGDKIVSYLKSTHVLISGLEIVEDWTKENGKISYQPVEVIPYSLGIPLNPIPIKQFADWNLNIDQLSFEETLKKKDFYYTIKKINSTEVAEGDMSADKTALLNGDWNNFIKKPIQKP